MLITTLSIVLGLFVPAHPKDLVFPEYVFTPPSVELYREELLNHTVPIYIAEDRELPLINIVATFRGGGYLDPANKVGLCNMMASLIRGGGTTSISAEELDEQFAYLAANASVRGGSTTITARLNCLSSNFEESFALFLDMLQHPGFQDSRLQLEKDSVVEQMKQRNDYPSGILSREFSSLLYGDSYLGRLSTEAMTQSITDNDLREQHALICNPANLILSVSGDFGRDKMLLFIEQSLSGWKMGVSVETPPSIDSNFTPGVYYVDQDVPQGSVKIGLRCIRQGDPDAEAVAIMNYIVGGGGFSSRITQKVRSDEGLAYSAGSRVREGVWGDGLWVASYESKSSTVALAAKLIFAEIERIRSELVSQEELELAKSAVIEQFPSIFQSKSNTLVLFVRDELTNRNSTYWNTYRSKISNITAEDVRRVAIRFLVPEDMVVVIVGNWSDIKDGDLGGRATMETVNSVITSNEFTELPLRDPLTLKVSN